MKLIEEGWHQSCKTDYDGQWTNDQCLEEVIRDTILVTNIDQRFAKFQLQWFIWETFDINHAKEQSPLQLMHFVYYCHPTNPNVPCM